MPSSYDNIRFFIEIIGNILLLWLHTKEFDLGIFGYDALDALSIVALCMDALCSGVSSRKE